MIKLLNGDCLVEMPKLAENSVDTILTDPPYGLSFMGKNWDHGVPGVAFWVEALRVAKPGAMLFAFGSTRTVHRLACAIEDAGWIIRDRLAWLTGQGFPKSHNISKAIDKAAGAEREVVGVNANHRLGQSLGNHPGVAMLGQPHTGDGNITAPATDAAQEWDGYGTALKPAQEIIIMAMKPLDGTFAQNAQKWGVAGLWIDGGRVSVDDNEPNKRKSTGGYKQAPRRFSGDFQQNINRPATLTQGRFPANILHDGSPEVMAVFPQTKSGKYKGAGSKSGGIWSESTGKPAGVEYGDSGSAARFFYCAKSSKRERNAGLEGMEAKAIERIRQNKTNPENSLKTGSGKVRNVQMQNHHPTVKPLALMRYLCKLSRTPTGGVVLDPFMGSGTTGKAAILEGREFIGIELDPEYFEIAKKRIATAQPGLL